ncbi:MAG: hypothetical protein PSV17_05075 [Methylotenera sp.]|uniref:hypothetical protein n=1 Tax=Methylotenera sp. TaxID=2051956 RepID=UPI002488AB00|nr:hypothetical protein [Methylotenera sp.]MDI1308793.1 hypothetical protein [Methylotenera sp.]
MHKINEIILSSCLLLVSTHVFALNFDAEDEKLGLYPENSMALTTGESCTKSCAADKPEQMFWYFNKEKIIVKKWYWGADSTDENMAVKDLPPLIWVGAEGVVTDAILTENGKQAQASGSQDMSLRLAPKIATNLSYWNDSTLQFFSQRSVRIRGNWSNETLDFAGKTSKYTQPLWITAHTIWPEDYKIDLLDLLKPLQKEESLKSLVQFENGGAKSAYESRLIWAKNTHPIENEPRQLAGKAVIGFLLNGAQGDDDEAHGGHFAVVTGRMEPSGDYSRWLVNNFYNLASNSEKGIIAAVTPMDKYLDDLNSGQSYYRPSYMLVAVLKTDKVPAQFQASINKTFTHFYRNGSAYDHSRNNCAGISIDTLRTLGWNIPARGVESLLKATAAYFYVSATEMSLTKGRAIYDYLNTETTRLFPAVTFDAVGEDLLLGANQWSRKLYTDNNPTTPYMRQIGEDIEAIYFVRIPQIPSSRAFGLAPVYSFDQYMQQAPADRSQWKIVPTTPNPLPERLKDGAALKLQSPSLLPLPVAAVLIFIIGGLTWLIRKLIKRRARI